ncbi:glutamate-ammonia-ligase adenylyltransferase [Solimonas aquatica]|uniref:Bifunctional glutamine synthetase adenylyltransferase/adenylyl-removing enzyme n=1 Tax=Solimonas aquatica TaxID=489703 RepID=A0A1H9E0U5_9GAMM|nr:bifunctional [glutamate--ammonia ligase]-adenylyl-L-tyrosine phosphorylase/[glutamate--ammonia-ligase] adenylyltransferase [Solimonas aquatica]SEQ19336.1 glutamate-ammonia-ligase adenylyltransferase [Solimonas aquatica]
MDEQTRTALHDWLPAALRDELPRLLQASVFLRESLPRLHAWGADAGVFARPLAAAELTQDFAALPQNDEAAYMDGLRRLRRLHMARIACRDLAGLALLDETLNDLSALADAACASALAYAQAQLQARHGVPRDAQGTEIAPVILGMGKLGGRELNFSSDIDLIFCHTEAGESDGARPLSSDEYFVKLAQLVQRLLAQVTPEGFVFRIDLMLRPFGSAGPLSASFAAMEEYYQVHGREWERYALIKARPVAGDLLAGTALLQALRPFVYRRYLDYDAIGSLRHLKRLIAEDVARKGQTDNVKLGRGGIRELEFIVQSFQLVRGGAERALRDTRLRPVLRYLGESGHLEIDVAAQLDESYVFLRRLENAIQIHADQQTHTLPLSEEARAALCAALRCESWASLLRQLERVREFVQQQFDRIFTEPERAAEPASAGLLRALWFGMLQDDAALEALTQAGYGRLPRELLQALQGLHTARLVRQMNEDAQQRLLGLLASLFDEALTLESAETALLRVLEVVQAIVGRSTYLTLLKENAVARRQLLQLCAASPWLSEFIARAPVLLDNLLDPRTLYAPPDREQIAAELHRRIDEVPVEDTEQGMNLLRRFQKEMTLRIAAADLTGVLPLVKVSDRLTWLAEALVDQALQRAWAEMRAQYGTPRRGDGAPAGFAVIAYGKFGGIELGYGSDLDLVFLHDCDLLDGDTGNGPRSINNGVFYARLAQRVINWLATQTPAGRVYEIDMELRPNGKSGLLVSSMASYASYQHKEAWTWEHQALTRARCVAGSPGLARAFAQLRREVLCQARDAQKLRQDIVEMRAKMRANLDKSSEEFWDVKQGEGGLIDIEFIAQYLLLREAHRAPAVIEYSDNWRQLDALAEAGVLDGADREVLIEAYRALRGISHRHALQRQGLLLERNAELTRLAARVIGIRHRILEA